MKLALNLAPSLVVIALTASLSGCGSSTYMSYENTQRGFDKAEAIEKAGDHRAAALAYEKLAAPAKPYALGSEYQKAWIGAGKSWAAAGDNEKALAAFQQAVASALSHNPPKPGEWPLFSAGAKLELGRFLAAYRPEQARAPLYELIGLADSLPPASDENRNSLLGSNLHDVAEILAKLGDPQQALRAALLGFDKDDSSQERQDFYPLAIQLAQTNARNDLAATLEARQKAVADVRAMIEAGSIAFAPWRKVGNTYTSTNYSKAETAQFYRDCAAIYRQRGQEPLAAYNDRYAALYQKWASDEAREAVAANSPAPASAPASSAGFGAQILGGLLQGAGMAMQQQGGYSSENAARATLVQGVGAALAGDQRGMDQATQQSFNLAARQKAAQGDAAGAMAATLAGQTYAGNPAANRPGANTNNASTGSGGCPDTLMYASGETTSYRSVAVQFSAAELQDSFQRFQNCMTGASGECYLFYRNGEPADYPLAALRGTASDPNDMNTRVFRCHAASGFASSAQ